MLGLSRFLSRQVSRRFSKVFPSFAGDHHSLILSDGKELILKGVLTALLGRKSFQIRMGGRDRSKFMSAFWEHKLLSKRLSGLGQSIDEVRLNYKDIAGSPKPSVATEEKTRPPRKMSDSFCEVCLPFRTNKHLLEDYTSIYGGIRFGKILEDLDVLAASIAYLHCDDLDLTIVTAAVDRIDLLAPIDAIVADIRMKGSVTYVGRSSIEVTLSVESNRSEDMETGWELAALAKFILVARSSDGSASVEVNRLQFDSPREEEIFQRGKERHQWRLRRDAESLYRMPPTPEESALVHQICMNRKIDCLYESKRLIPTASTQIQSMRVCHRQERNIHNYIFGGYLCREAFELAFANATLFFGGARPNLKAIDEISFVHPVPIGSLLNFSSQIVYSTIIEGKNYAAIEVVADVINPQTGERLTTNTFRFTMFVPVSEGEQDIPAVLPETYVEAMKYLEAKRRISFDLAHPTQLDASPNPPHFDPTIDN